MVLSNTMTLALFSSALILALLNHSVVQNSPRDYVAAHNSARSSVGVGSMTWDNIVPTYAQNYANKRKDDCRLLHSGGSYGENLFWGSGREFTAIDAVRAWVSERKYYNYNSNTCQRGQQCGHYTQVVWRNSVNVGCARVRCNNGAWFIICNYSPLGNFVGKRPY